MAQPSVEIGIKGGLGLARLSGSNLEGSEPVNGDLGNGFTGVGQTSSSIKDMKTGFSGGAYATLRFSERFAMRLETLYSMKGGKGNNSGSIDIYDSSNNYVGTLAISGTNRMTLNYFEIPILGVVSFPSGPNSTFELFAGPSFALKTSAKLKQTITASFRGQSDTQTQTTDISNVTKSSDFGGVLGAGMSFKIGTPVLFTEARWTAGFSKIDDSGSNADWKNSAFGISAGIGFPLTTAVK